MGTFNRGGLEGPKGATLLADARRTGTAIKTAAAVVGMMHLVGLLGWLGVPKGDGGSYGFHGRVDIKLRPALFDRHELRGVVVGRGRVDCRSGAVRTRPVIVDEMVRV